MAVRVALSGDRIVVGVNRADDNGSGYVYDLN